MSFRSLLVVGGIAGSCTAVGVPVSVQESQRLRNLWGDDWAYASDVTSLLGGAERGDGKPIDNTVRVFICKELGAVDTSYVNDVVNNSVSTWQYSCHKNGENSKVLTFNEDPKSTYYEWTGVDNNSRITVRCLRIASESADNTKVDWSRCKKK